MLFIVEHNGTVLGESDPLLIKSTFNELSISIINFNVNLPVIPSDKENINSIVSIPILSKNQYYYNSFYVSNSYMIKYCLQY